MKYLVDKLDLLLVLLVGILLGLSTAFTIEVTISNEDMHDMQVEAVMYECAHWNVEGEFEWNGPSMDGLTKIEKDES